MTPELALPLGRAVTFVAGRGKNHAPRVLVGKDTRLSGYMLETGHRLAASASMGGRVMLCGPMPTPAVAHLTVSMRADAGIVISASHNPYARQRHQDLRRRRLQAARRGRGRDRGASWATSDAPRASARPAPASAGPSSSRTRAAATSSSPKQTFPRELVARRRARGGRRGARRGLRGGARSCFQELGAQVTAHRREAQRRQHQQGRPAPSTPSTCAPRW